MLLLFTLALLSDSACIQIESSRITAHALSLRLPAFSALAPETPLAQSPMPEARREFTASQLAALAARLGLNLDTSQAAPICFYRPSAQSSNIDWPQSIQQALAEHFHFHCHRDEIRILSTRLHLAPHGKPQWSKNGLRYDASRAGYIWRVQLRNGDEAGSGAIGFQLLAKTPRWMTREALPAGHILRAEDLHQQLAPSRPELASGATSVEELVGRALRRALPAGVAIEPSHLKAAPLVLAGQTVEVTSRSGQALVRTSAIARNPAAKGDPVIVWQPEAKRLLRTIATGPNAVEITNGRK
jgi:flagella basal body P-ring formation protein FlgA